MKKYFLLFLGLLLVVSSTWAADVKKVAVLPFTVNSADNIDNIRDGIWDMLISRISVDGKIDVAERYAVSDAMGRARKKGLTRAEVYSLGRKMKVDYVVWGSITKIGNNISVDGKLVDMASGKSPVSVFVQSQGMDEVIPKINDFAKRIDYHILGRVPSTFEALPSPALPPAVPAMPQQASQQQGQTPTGPREPQAAEALRSKEGTFTSVINPDFITAPQPLDRKGFWMSQKFETSFVGMDIGDVYGDGKNEVVVIDVNSVMIYRKEGKALKLLQKIRGESYNQYLSVDVADINGNGVQEIFVTCMSQGTLDSFVLEYRDGKFVKIASRIRAFLRVISVSGKPVLIGQSLGVQSAFDSPIYEYVWRSGKYKPDRKMKIPQGLAVYDVMLEPLDKDGPDKVIALDDYDYIRVYEPTDVPFVSLQKFGGSRELIWKSDEKYGGSNNFFDTLQTSSNVASTDNPPPRPYVNIRMLSYDISKKGKKELIVAKNISAVGRVFKNLKAFTSSEIYDLEWNGIGFADVWKTKKIQGYISDIQIKDIDNDGKDEVVIALILSADLGLNARSVVVSYTITPQP
ncbi:MAG: FG-GAP-like repeat-containing protein [Syntrophales bacterium]